MKMVCLLPSAGRALTALCTVLYSPVVVVPARTTSAPVGGVVRVAAKALWMRKNPAISLRYTMLLFVCAHIFHAGDKYFPAK